MELRKGLFESASPGATRVVLSSILMADGQFTPFVLVWYDSLISTCLLLATSLAFELRGLAQYFTTTPWQGLAILALSATIAFACTPLAASLPASTQLLTPL